MDDWGKSVGNGRCISICYVVVYGDMFMLVIFGMEIWWDVSVYVWVVVGMNV